MMLRFGLAIAAGLACGAGAQAATMPSAAPLHVSPLVQQVQYYRGYGRGYDEDGDWRRDEWRRRRWREEQARRDEWRRENWRRQHRDYDDDE